MESRRRFLSVGGGAVLGASAVAALGGRGTDSAGGGDQRRDGSTLRALVAGSLLGIAGDVPDAAVEAHGSLAVRRLLLDGARDPDAVALADPTLFAGIAPRIRLFATNALVVAYDPDSSHAAAIRDDWARGLTREGIRIGRTDPETDPLGYRTLLALKLAERRGLADRSSVLSRSTILPETSIGRVVAGGKLDAAFVYRSMAVEADVPYVDLPPAIDFSDPTHADTYASVSIALGDRTVRGAPIRYGAAATTPAGDPWVDALATGRDRLREHGFSVPGDYPRTVSIDRSTQI